jgi:hypothetical protein
MSPTIIAAIVAYSICALAVFAFGLRYLMRQSYMPYQEEAAGKPWSAIEPRLQLTILAMLRVDGAGMFGTGASSIAALLVAYGLTGARGVLLLAVVPGLVFGIPTLIAAWTLRRETGAHTPVPPTIAALTLAVIGLVLAAV